MSFFLQVLVPSILSGYLTDYVQYTAHANGTCYNCLKSRQEKKSKENENKLVSGFIEFYSLFSVQIWKGRCVGT